MNTSDTLLDTSALDAARALYQGEGLDLPAIPADLASNLRQVDATAYATRDLDWTLYDFGHFLNELQSGKTVEPYVAFGLAGHGLTQQAAHYYAVMPHCAVLFQMRWGTIMDRPEQDRARHNAMLSIAQRLQTAADTLARAGKLPAGQRMVVADSSLHGARWAWLPANGAAQGEPEWHANRSAAVQALATLMQLR
jgi:hypothetical protein